MPLEKTIIDLCSYVAVFLLLLSLGLFVGRFQEKRHYRSLRNREESLRDILLIPVRRPPEGGRPYRTDFVIGSAVIAMDYFKRFLGSLKQLLGGQISNYETLLERARREAVLRMKKEARNKNAQMVFNVKFATATILDQKGRNTGCVEVVAYGTAIIYR